MVRYGAVVPPGAALAGRAAKVTSSWTRSIVPAPPIPTQADSSPITATAHSAARPPPGPAPGRPARVPGPPGAAGQPRAPRTPGAHRPPGRNRRSRRLLVTTSTELAAIAIPANTGLR